MKARELLAWNMRRVRVAQGLSQERLAVDAAVNRGYLGGLEQLTENPTLDILDRIATALSVPVADLLREPDAGQLPPAPMKGGRRKA